MAGYSGTPLWKKLGYKSGLRAYLDAAPADYVQLLELPPDVQVAWLDKKESNIRFVHLFERNGRALRTKLGSYRKKMASDGVIWVSWPKKCSSRLTLTKARSAKRRCRSGWSTSKFAPLMKSGRR